MKLVLNLVARDEEDILRQNLLYHLNQGVDFIIAMDNGSIDGTKDIIQEFVSLGVAKYIHMPHYSHSQSIWMTQMSKVAHQECAADMIINSDADEFWWPEEGDLKSTLEKIADDVEVVRVRRNDFVPVEEKSGVGIFERMVFRDPSEVNGIGRPLRPKVIHRPAPGVFISAGNHGAWREDREVKKVDSNDIVILHFPMRTYSQFATKIRQGGLALNTFHKESITPTRLWCVLYERLMDGTLNDYYLERMAVDAVPDYRLRDFMREHQIV